MSLKEHVREWDSNDVWLAAQLVAVALYALGLLCIAIESTLGTILSISFCSSGATIIIALWLIGRLDPGD